MNSHKKPVLTRGELAAEIIMVKDHLLELLFNYKESYGNEDEIKFFATFLIGRNWKYSGIREMLDTDINAAMALLPKEGVTSGVIAVVNDRNSYVG